MHKKDFCPVCGETEYKNVNGKPVCGKCGRTVTEEEIATDIKAKFQELREESKTLEKYEALLNYIEAYDFKELPTLMFPREDAEYLRKACEKQIPKKSKKYLTSVNGNYGCPVCGNVGRLNYCSNCGQKLC